MKPTTAPTDDEIRDLWAQHQKHLPSYVRQLTNSGSCRGCDAPILWVVTKKGKRMPLDPAHTDVRDCYESHHAHCPDVESFRRKKTRPR